MPANIAHMIIVHKAFELLRIEDFRIHRPRIGDSEGVNFGLWLQFRKPKAGEERAEKQ